MNNIDKLVNKAEIKLLLIGDKEWCNRLQYKVKALNANFTYEVISDVEEANQRLDHNSYDVLIISEKFTKKHSIHLTKKAYAMSRPTFVICDSFLINIKYKTWKFFSKFTRTYKTYKKLVFFSSNLPKLSLVQDLGKNHQSFFSSICKEIDASLIFKIR